MKSLHVLTFSLVTACGGGLRQEHSSVHDSAVRKAIFACESQGSKETLVLAKSHLAFLKFKAIASGPFNSSRSQQTYISLSNGGADSAVFKVDTTMLKEQNGALKVVVTAEDDTVKLDKTYSCVLTETRD